MASDLKNKKRKEETKRSERDTRARLSLSPLTIVSARVEERAEVGAKVRRVIVAVVASE